MKRFDLLKIISVRICWSKGKDWLISKNIQRLDKSFFNHVFLMITFSNGLVLILESHFKGGVQITTVNRLARAKASGKVIFTYEHEIKMEEESMMHIWSRFCDLDGDGYDIKRIIGYWLWIRLTSKKGKKAWKLHSKGKYTCNELVVELLSGLCEKLPVRDFRLTPEGLFVRFIGESSLKKFAPKPKYPKHAIID